MPFKCLLTMKIGLTTNNNTIKTQSKLQIKSFTIVEVDYPVLRMEDRP